jgi:hypothetical protein
VDRFDPGHFAPPDDAPAEVVAELIDRLERLARRVITSRTEYLAVYQNECRHVVRIARRAGLSREQTDALAAWHDRSVLHQLQLGEQPKPRSRAPHAGVRPVPSGVRAVPLLRASRHAIGRALRWAADRRVDVRAWFLRVTGRD